MNPEPTEEIERSPALVDQLRQLGNDYGPLGVALAAIEETDANAVVSYLLTPGRLSEGQTQVLAAYIAPRFPGEPSRSEGAGETAIRLLEAQRAAIAGLVTAIAHTVEYVGLDTLPAKPGWSWYDALRRYDPETLASLVDRTKPVPAEPGTAVGPHEFDRLSRLRPRTCRACWYHRDDHPITAWVPARPLGDTGPPDPPTLDRQSTSPRPNRRPGRHRAPTIAP